jgi:hypothetical protein
MEYETIFCSTKSPYRYTRILFITNIAKRKEIASVGVQLFFCISQETVTDGGIRKVILYGERQCTAKGQVRNEGCC